MPVKTIKNIEYTLLGYEMVMEIILGEFEEDKNIIYNIWKDNEIIAVLIPYTEDSDDSGESQGT